MGVHYFIYTVNNPDGTDTTIKYMSSSGKSGYIDSGKECGDYFNLLTYATDRLCEISVINEPIITPQGNVAGILSRGVTYFKNGKYYVATSEDNFTPHELYSLPGNMMVFYSWNDYGTAPNLLQLLTKDGKFLIHIPTGNTFGVTESGDIIYSHVDPHVFGANNFPEGYLVKTDDGIFRCNHDLSSCQKIKDKDSIFFDVTVLQQYYYFTITSDVSLYVTNLNTLETQPVLVDGKKISPHFTDIYKFQDKLFAVYVSYDNEFKFYIIKGTTGELLKDFHYTPTTDDPVAAHILGYYKGMLVYALYEGGTIDPDHTIYCMDSVTTPGKNDPCPHPIYETGNPDETKGFLINNRIFFPGLDAYLPIKDYSSKVTTGFILNFSNEITSSADKILTFMITYMDNPDFTGMMKAKIGVMNKEGYFYVMDENMQMISIYRLIDSPERLFTLFPSIGSGITMFTLLNVHEEQNTLDAYLYRFDGLKSYLASTTTVTTRDTGIIYPYGYRTNY